MKLLLLALLIIPLIGIYGEVIGINQGFFALAGVCALYIWAVGSLFRL